MVSGTNRDTDGIVLSAGQDGWWNWSRHKRPAGPGIYGAPAYGVNESATRGSWLKSAAAVESSLSQTEAFFRPHAGTMR